MGGGGVIIELKEVLDVGVKVEFKFFLDVEVVVIFCFGEVIICE